MYKTISFTALIMAAIQLNCTAQENQTTAKYKIRIGIKGGLNFSNLFTETGQQERDKMLAGINIGLFAKQPLTRFIAIQPELYFSTKGAKITYPNTSAIGTARFRLNYLQLPVLAVVNIDANFKVHAGSYVAFLIDGRVKNESNVQHFDFEKKSMKMILTA